MTNKNMTDSASILSKFYMKKIITIVLLFFAALNTIPAEDGKGKISGYMFGDYYYIISHHNKDDKDLHGFWFRRIYFTYDYKIDKSFSSRLRLEMSNEGDFTSKVAIVPVVKDAWLKYKFSSHNLILGISPTPTFQVIEKYWGYRSVEKTPLDLQKMASSRDFGLAAKGSFEKAGTIKYHLMFSNGSSNKQEVDKGKSGMLALGFYPFENMVFQVYGEYADAPGIDDAYTYQAFFGYKNGSTASGIMYADQTLEKHDKPDIKRRVISAFFNQDFAGRFTLLLRADHMFDPNTEGEKIDFTPFDNSAKSTLFIAGIDWRVVKGVSLIPNLKYVLYSMNDKGIKPGNDLYGNITFFWKFN